jgi:hypothetical protein
MPNHTSQEKAILNKILALFEDDTEKAIDFLVNELSHDRDELDDTGSYEINQTVVASINDLGFDQIKNILEYTEGFEDIDFSIDDSLNIAAGTMRQPCKEPCPSCPYTVKAIAGDFGGNDPAEYADAIHRDTIVACHSRTKHDKTSHLPNSEDDITICTGHIVSQIVVLKRSDHPEGRVAQDRIRELPNFEALKTLALGFNFKDFHGLD